jgi:oxygen-dependent protoporphyrinogen oxidase
VSHDEGAQAFRVAIVGGGISGLTLAYRLLSLASHDRASGVLRRPVEVTLLEAGAHLGGVIRTERTSGYVIDGGPDSFVATKPAAARLARELGLGDQLIGTLPENRKVYVARRGALVPLPEGLMLGIPTQLASMARSPIVSPLGKLRMAFEPLVPRRRGGSDETIASFVRRRLGAEAVEAIAAPLLGGIFAGDVDSLGIQATFPQFVEYEERDGSLIRGARRAIRERAAAKTKASGSAAARPSLAGSAFLSLLGGMGSLVDTLAERARALGAHIELGAPVRAIRRAGAAAHDKPLFAMVREGGAELTADHVVVATPAHAAAELLAGVAPDVSQELAAIPYVSTATVALGFSRSDLPHPLDAHGVLLPKRGGSGALAITFVSSKWEARAPDGSVLVRVFVGGPEHPDLVREPDEALVRVATSALREHVGLAGEPRLARVFRYARASVQPVVGHLDRIARVRALLTGAPGLSLLGPPYDGVGMPDCIALAEKVAAALCPPAGPSLAEGHGEGGARANEQTG